MGDFRRNVGDYQNAVKAALSDTEQNLGELKKQLMELKCGNYCWCVNFLINIFG